MPDRTKNDIAWEKLFEKYSILEKVRQNDNFIIRSSQINEFRESRLMAKFDHFINLPTIFRKNKLSIMPISRTEYIIGHFKTHYDLDSTISEIISVSFPDHIQSISPQNLYSESIAINCAYITGMIDNLLNQKSIHVISGRMSTGCFDFEINHTVKTDNNYPISVNNSQCEIDAGFETDDYLILIEAKNYSVDDFLIRQLYYPYRLWQSRVSKKVIPVLMTFSNDIFDFYIFQFQDGHQYHSIQLINHKKFVIEPEPIFLNEIYHIFTHIKIIEDSADIPFPQADKIERVIDLLSLLFDKNLTREEITENYQFDIRQADYYIAAGNYLGLIQKYKDKETKEIVVQLTHTAINILNQDSKQKYLSLIKIVLSHRIFYDAFKIWTQSGRMPLKSEIVSLMTEMKRPMSDNVKNRRAQTVLAWIQWICQQAD
ncbi:MAG: translation elongation factor [Microcoleaceae cyanobacterium]